MKTPRDDGFTLVELMVVVLIIGILVSIAIPVFNTARTKAITQSCVANMRTVDGAAQTWHAQNDGAFPADWNTLMARLVPDYLKQAPVCAAAGTYSWDPATGSTSCTLHGRVGASHDAP